MENCPFCRLVREALTELDLDVLIRPCPKNGERFRPDVVERGGKAQFPFLVDPNEGVTLYESADIIEYLGRTYDGRVSGTRGLRRNWRVFTSSLASAANAYRGMRARPSTAPDQPLELYSFESSPYCRLVREVLCELELPYVLRNMGKVSRREYGWPWVRDRVWKAPKASGRNRTRLAELTGHVQVPYLVDPNTDTAMFESADIVDYLRRRYGRS
jgi:glutathione S-transferase